MPKVRTYKTIGAHVSIEFSQRLEDYCWAVHRRPSAVIREAVDEYLTAHDALHARIVQALTPPGQVTHEQVHDPA